MRFCNVIVIFLFFASLPVAWAWIPPSFHVVQTLARKHDALTPGRITSRLTLLKPSGEILKTFTETLVFTDLEQATSKIVDETGIEIGTRTRKLIGTRSSDLSRPVLYDLLFIKDKESIFDHFRTLGLPLKTESELYAEKEGFLPYRVEPYVAWLRYESRIATVIGDIEAAKKGKIGRLPQLWMEKGSYLPLRAYFPKAAPAVRAANPIEFRFSGYQPFRTGFLYPRSIEVLVDEHPWIKIDTIDVRLGDLKPLENTKAGSQDAVPNESRDFAEKYFEWIR